MFNELFLLPPAREIQCIFIFRVYRYHIYLPLTLLPSLLLSTLAIAVPQSPLNSKISGKYAMASCGRGKMNYMCVTEYILIFII